MKKKLKISFIINEISKIPNWQKKIFSNVGKLSFVKVVYYYIIPYKKRKIKRSLISAILFKIITVVEYSFFKNKIELNSGLKNNLIPNFFLRYEYKKNKLFINIKNFNEDIIINLTDRLISKEILKYTKNGIWGMHHSDNDFQRNGLGGFFEILENKNYSAITLQKYDDNIDGGKIVGKEFYVTKNFFTTNHYYLLNKSSDLITKYLKLFYEKKLIIKKSKKYKKKLYHFPNVKEQLYYLGKIILNAVKQIIKKDYFLI